MALGLPEDRRATILLFVSLAFVVVGTSLIYNATLDKDFNLPSPESFRYEATYFYFMWVSAFVTTSFQRPILMAITAGLLCALMVFSYSLDEMDLIRININTLKDASDKVPSGVSNPFEDPLKLLQKIAAGFIIAYIGAGLAFIASVLVFRRPRRSQGFRLPLAGCILLFGFIGCILLWTSRDMAVTISPEYKAQRSAVGSALFDVTDGTAAVLVVFLVGITCEIVPLTYVSAFLAAFYNLSSLSTYLSIKDGKLESEEQDAAGIIFCWLSAVFMVFFCAQEEGSPENGYESTA